MRELSTVAQVMACATVGNSRVAAHEGEIDGLKSRRAEVGERGQLRRRTTTVRSSVSPARAVWQMRLAEPTIEELISRSA